MKLEYTVVLEPDEEEGGYTVTVPALPGCVSEGDSIEEALENIREAIELYVEGLKERGQPAPIERAAPELRKVTVAA